jgi:23S rRNA pseudouridine1911/1915/1917 synthase
MNDQTFHISADQAGQTLAALIRRWHPELSWSDARSIVEKRRVVIQGNLCLDPARRLKAGEVVKVMGQAQKKTPTQEQIKIRHLDAHIVIVEKPARMTTVRHPEEKDWPARRKQLQPTLDELLPKVIAREEKLGRGFQRGGLPKVRPVHRLDRDTSGLMVFARTVEAERHLGKQFKKHSIHRIYLAIVQGQLQAPMTIASNLVRDRGDGRRGSTTLPNLGKHAITHVKPRELLPECTLVQCQLETGRTHQIRIHLAEHGFPIFGEKVYNRAPFKEPKKEEISAARIMLHAAELGFAHPVTGVNLKFSMPMPPDMNSFWQSQKKRIAGQ